MLGSINYANTIANIACCVSGAVSTSTPTKTQQIPGFFTGKNHLTVPQCTEFPRTTSFAVLSPRVGLNLDEQYGAFHNFKLLLPTGS